MPAEAWLFRAPRSYTRQDVVELHMPGSAAVLSLAADTLLRASRGGELRLAEAGEFTARAFLNGAMDLTEVEGVAALIRARSDAECRAAQGLARGEISHRCQAAAEALTDLLALVEADIDFADEPLEFLSPADARQRLESLAGDLDELMTSSQDADRLEVLPTVALLGRPNAGKSTLLNRLTGVDRAICSPLAGTTRDVLTAPLRTPRGEILLADGPGLRMAGRRATAAARGPSHVDAVVPCGSFHDATLCSADLVCLVADVAAEPLDPGLDLLADLPDVPSVVAANKIDLLGDREIRRRLAEVQRGYAGPILPISALTGAGCDALASALLTALDRPPAGASGARLALNARHREALAQAVGALRRAIDLARSTDDLLDVADLLALELREASDHLGTITGKVTVEDLLGRIFSRFCIGK